MNYVYILKCRDGSLYTGWTTNLKRRVRAHNTGKAGAKYTRSRRPVMLVYYEMFQERSDALRREAGIKKLNHAQKCRLIREGSGVQPAAPVHDAEDMPPAAK